VRNAGSQLIRALTFCQESAWSHIKYDRKGDTATIFHHIIVCPYVATKTSEKEPGKSTNDISLYLRRFSIKLDNSEAGIQTFGPSRGSGNGKVSEE
jgi:hypothetical protein